MASIVSLLLNPWVIFFGALIVVTVAIVALTVVERRMNRKLSIRKAEDESFFQRQARYLNRMKNNPQQFILSLDRVAREFLKEKYQIDKSKKYSDLIEIFRKSGNRKAMQFCEEMQESIYGGVDLTAEKLDTMLVIFEALLTAQLNRERKEREIIENSKSFFSKIPSKFDSMLGKSGLPDDNIFNFISEGLKRGFTIDVLRRRLLAQGFKEKEISQAIEQERVSRETARKKIGTPVDEKKRRKQPFIIYTSKSSSARSSSALELASGRDLSADEYGTVPYEKEKVEKKTVKVHKSEPKSQKNVRSLDDLDRVKEKIERRKKELSRRNLI